eukprot:scaffold17987_cov37-Attheya_sp.AAC.1
MDAMIHWYSILVSCADLHGRRFRYVVLGLSGSSGMYKISTSSIDQPHSRALSPSVSRKSNRPSGVHSLRSSLRPLVPE